MLHNAAGKGASAFGDVTGFDIEDHCVDLFYWFDKSTQRKRALKEYFEFCDTEYEAVIKYIQLKKYEALKSYFISEHERDNRFQRLNAAFSDPMIAIFSIFNRFMQRKDLPIYMMNAQMETFLRKLAVKFVKPEVKHKERSENLKSFDISIESQKADGNLSIGMATKGKLAKLLEEGDIDLQRVDKFYDGIRTFYSSAFACILHQMAST